MEIFDKLIDDFNNSSAWLEFFIVLCGLGLAYAMVRVWGRQLRVRGRSAPIWFGLTPLSGALFPLLALVLIYGAQLVVIRYMPVFWLRLAVSLLFSLTVIRFVARVLSHAFPNSTGVRLVERLFSWMVWGVAVLHSLGLLPMVLRELDDTSLTLGKTQLSLLSLIEGSVAAGLVLVVVLWLASLLELHVIER